MTKRLAWITDPHLNFVDRAGRQAFHDSIEATRSHGVILTGDIGEAHDVCHYLSELYRHLGLPIYFVLGNHDFYRGTIREVRDKVAALCASEPGLHWMNASGVVSLSETTCLIGHDGWGDGRFGDPRGSDVFLNDWLLIGELTGLNLSDRLAKLGALGDEAAEHFRTALPQALARFSEILVLIHVPPFREATWHQGRISDDDWLPHFSCKAAGEALVESMKERPDCKMTVLCGHTHGSGMAQILPNLCVLTGEAVYGEPKVQRVLEIA